MTSELPTERDLRLRRQELWLEAERLIESHRGAESRGWSRRNRKLLDDLLNQIDRLDGVLGVMPAEPGFKLPAGCFRCGYPIDEHTGDLLTCPGPPLVETSQVSQARPPSGYRTRCSYCRRPNEADSHRCSNCGAPLG